MSNRPDEYRLTMPHPIDVARIEQEARAYAFAYTASAIGRGCRWLVEQARRALQPSHRHA